MDARPRINRLDRQLQMVSTREADAACFSSLLVCNPGPPHSWWVDPFSFQTRGAPPSQSPRT